MVCIRVWQSSGVNSSVFPHLMCKVEGEMYFYTRVWIKPGFRFPPRPPLIKDVAKIMFLTAIYVNFLRNLLTAIIVNFNLYWSSHCYGGGIQWEGKVIAFRIHMYSGFHDHTATAIFREDDNLETLWSAEMVARTDPVFFFCRLWHTWSTIM